jgi:triosephosphate isomerase
LALGRTDVRCTSFNSTLSLRFPKAIMFRCVRRAKQTDPEVSRRLFIGANWKCSLQELPAVDALISALNTGWAKQTSSLRDVELCVSPPHVFLGRVRDKLTPGVLTGAQNVHEAVGPVGAGTGVTTGALLRAVGCSWVMLGHSDRRNTFMEADALLAAKAAECLEAGLGVNLTIGETRTQRDAGDAIATVLKQVEAVAARVPAGSWAKVVIAYEPVWAVGEGATPCTPEETQRVHGEIRSYLCKHAGEQAAAACRLVYTGSVSVANAESYAVLQDVDGFVVGRAGLDADALLHICAILARCKSTPQK